MTKLKLNISNLEKLELLLKESSLIIDMAADLSTSDCFNLSSKLLKLHNAIKLYDKTLFLTELEKEKEMSELLELLKQKETLEKLSFEELKEIERTSNDPAVKRKCAEVIEQEVEKIAVRGED